MRYIALLRGINVGGHTVKMDELRQHFEGLGLQNVKTYIQTGNVFFDTEAKDEEALAQKIENHLEEKLGFAVPTCLRTVTELEEILKAAPYLNKEPAVDERFCIIFTRQLLPAIAAPETAPKNDLEVVAMREREAFVTWKIIGGRPPSSQSNTWLNKLLGSPGTSRFYHTSQKILDAARAA